MPKRGVGVIEDDGDIRAVVRELLLDAGYDMVEAGDGPEGLMLLNSSPERLIALLDYLMPVLDGGKLLERVAQVAEQRLESGEETA